MVKMNEFFMGLVVGAVANIALAYAGTSILGGLVKGNQQFCSKYTGAQNKLCLGDCSYWRNQPAEFSRCMKVGGTINMG